MSVLELERLVHDCGADHALNNRMAASTTADQAAEIARSAGYGVTGDELKAYAATQRDGKTEFSANELDAVSAGQSQRTLYAGVPYAGW